MTRPFRRRLSSMSQTEIEYLDGITPGTQAASKAVVADANVNTGVSKITALHIGASGSETQVTATAAELNYLDIATLGTGAASKAIVLDASGDYTFPATGTIIFPSSATLTMQSGSTFNVAGTFQIGGVTVGATAAEIDAVADASAGAVRKIAKIAFGATELGGTETNTSFSFPANGAIATNAWIYVADGEAGTMDVGTQGTSNDPDGILAGIDLTNTGWVFPDFTYTDGLTGSYISATTFGALTHHIELGTDSTNDAGVIIPKGVFITGADPVSITSSGDLDSCSGFLFIEYIELGAVV